MTSLLRSSKFVRYFAGFTRSLIFNPTAGTDASFVAKNHCLTTGFTKSLATQTVSSHPQQESNLDRSLRRLDQDVRRSGRISRRELEDVLEELRHARSATSSQSLLIIRCCGNLVPEEPPAVRTQLVQEIWKTLENQGVPMDVSHYNALLRVYLENEHRFSPTEFLANLEKKGVEPNRVTYQRLIACYCQEGDIEGATRILEFMREKQLPVNESVFNALIMGHSQADDMESAMGILQVMRQAGLEPSADTYTALLCGHAKRGNMDAINSLLKESDAKDIFLLDKDYMDVIYTLAVNNHLQYIDEILNKMRQMAGYNQDAVNLIYRLVNVGHEDVAMKVLLTMPRAMRDDGEPVPTGSFLVRQLVRANRPVEKTVSICLQLERDGLNPRALCFATETSLSIGNFKQANAFLAAMKKEGYPIRHHYFWPLLMTCSNRGDKQGLLNVLQKMNTEFGLVIGGETLREYALPGLVGQGELSASMADTAITELRSVGVSVASAVCAFVFNLVIANKLSDAAQVACRYRAVYPLPLFRRPLAMAYRQTRDTTSFITLVRMIYEGARQADVTGEDDNQGPAVDSMEIVGQLVSDVVQHSQDKLAITEDVLQGLLAQGLSISNSAAERIQEKLGGELTNEISTLLSKLTSGDLVPLAMTRSPGFQQVTMNEAQLMSTISSMEARGESPLRFKRQLLIVYCRNKELEKAEQLVKELETDNFVLGSGIMAQLIELYTHHEMVDEALKILGEIKTNDPGFCLDDTKMIRLATLLVNKDKFKDAVKILKDHPRDNKLEVRSFAYNSLCWRLLNTLAEQGNEEAVQEMFQVLLDCDFIAVNSVLLGPLVKVHMVKNDLSAALAKLEECVNKYRTTPWKNELACKLIQAEDAAKLQYLTDLSTKVHGEMNSLYDLVFAFVECGRIRQARKILETPGLKDRPQRMTFACERYRHEGLVAPLEGLVEATRDLSYIDRSHLFYHLLLSYCNAKDPEKALGLWTRMQEEDVQPTDQFLATLGTFLEEEGRDVPFEIPSISVPPTTGTLSTVSEVRQFRQPVKKEKKERLESVTNISTTIEGLVKDNKLGEASELTLEKLSAGIHPLPRVFRFLLGRLAAAGDVDTLLAIGKTLDSEKKKMLAFDNRLCHAYVVSGRGDQYLDILEKEIDDVTEDTLEVLCEQFPRGGGIGLLKEQPKLSSKFETVARKYAKHGFLAPVNVLWIHLMVTGQEAAADKVWGEFLENSPRLMFQQLAKVAREKRDSDLARKIVDKLKKTQVSDGALGVAYSCLIDVLANSAQADEGLKVLETAVKDVCLECINRTALQRLQKVVQQQGKTFPYQIPVKNVNQSSSSSSDDESKPTST